MKIISSPEIPAPAGHFSSGIQAGGFVFVSGQTPRDRSRQIVGATIEEQTVATMKNVESVLHAAGASLGDVVKATVHLENLEDAARFNAVYATFFPNNRPARTTVGSRLNGVLVEIDVTAYVGGKSTVGDSS